MITVPGENNYRLVLLTSQFPFGTGEAFIESEITFLSGRFSKIIIISFDSKNTPARALPAGTEVFRYNTSTTLSGWLFLPALIIRNIGLISRLAREEAEFRRDISFVLTPGMKIFLYRKIIKAIQLRNFIDRVVSGSGGSSNTVFYSYWLKGGAHSLALCNYENSIRIARAHGSDLYEEKTPGKYLPLFRLVTTGLDGLFFISQNGRNYFSEKTKILSESHKYYLSYLGVAKPEQMNLLRKPDEIFTIVSCSNIVSLKRIHLIINSLSDLDVKIKVQWIHFGDGPRRNEIEELAARKLENKVGIIFKFMGHLPNRELLDFYNNNFVDLFLNVSSSEGLPVSIMEAQAFGIPVIATDVGGVSEIIDSGTGVLLPPDFSPGELIRAILYFMDLSPQEYETFRKNAIAKWDSKFNASKNYIQFLNEVNSIFESTLKRSYITDADK